MAVLACVLVTVYKEICAFTMLHTLTPLAFVFIAVTPSVHSIAIGFSFFPFSNVGVSVAILIGCQFFPDSISVTDATRPLAIIHLLLGFPVVDAFTVSFTFLELPNIGISVRIQFESSAVSLVIFPLAFKNSSILVLHYAFTLSEQLACSHTSA